MKGQGQHWCSLLVMILVGALWTTQPGMALVISEVMYHPVEDTGTPDGNETLEFIELYNNRAVFEDLSGYTFTNGINYTFPDGTILGAKEYLVVAKDPNAIRSAYPEVPVGKIFGPFEMNNEGTKQTSLDNDGERIELSNANEEIIISFRYNDARPWPNAPDGTGHSLILARPGADPEGASAWAPSTFIGGTPGGPDEAQVGPPEPNLVTLVDVGHPGRYFKGTQEPSPGPGGEPNTAWTEIGFNDDPNTTAWLNGPSGYGYSNQPEELLTINTILSDMQGGYTSVYARLRFTVTAEQIASFTQLRSTVHYDDGYVLYLNGEEIPRANVNGDPPAFYTEGNSASDYGPDMRESSSWVSLLVPGTNVLAIQGHNTNPSTSSDFVLTAELDGVIVPVSGGDDIRARVVINELLANSDAAPGTDWLELYNPGPIPVDLNDVYLSDGRFELLQYKIPDGIVLQPGEFWAV